MTLYRRRMLAFHVVRQVEHDAWHYVENSWTGTKTCVGDVLRLCVLLGLWKREYFAKCIAMDDLLT